MRLYLPVVALSLLPLGGCNINAFHGIFLVKVPAPDQQAECTFDVVAHNFTNGNVPEGDTPDDGPWTYADDGEYSDALFFVEIVDSAKGETLLIQNGSVYPGEKEGGTYTFYWNHFQDGTSSEEHEGGYEYTTSGLSSTEDTILVDRAGQTISGTWTQTSTSRAIYSESDEWDSFEVGRYDGYIPSSYYLTDDDDFPIYNTPEEADCDDDPCELEVEESCTFVLTFTGTEATLDDEAYENVESSGQPGGWE